jgi:hypothetical protein
MTTGVLYDSDNVAGIRGRRLATRDGGCVEGYVIEKGVI